ncbi:hypothetical protein ACVNS2_33905 [Paenibacillus caseinilyticus]|uniref:Uncharacterized protein n=1 Tax=Paenibacillus mucilaginosus K02 TaxID=997761 RepID=I0BTK7_9BACL|nr:hypothetical protein [Paenibacillus mucilaginosus]AFH65704.2 hypothetical protein B2K_34235 [Paenibacillus mucilaginosus K02]WFA21804.1 hypothetical protein ERY13_33710 [Paenibacillus mucilaginosus]
MIREERGSALLLVLFMIVVFTMLGIAVTGAAVGGAKLAVKRENDVQSLHLAEKALNVAAAYIAEKYNGKSQEEITSERLQQDVLDIKSELESVQVTDSENSVDPQTEASEANVDRIGTIEAIEDAGEINKGRLLRVIAKAVVGGVERKLVQEITLQTYPPFLDYVMGSKGKVKVNGSPYMIGDMYAGEQLLVKNEAEYYYNSDEFTTEPDRAATLYPTMDGKAVVETRNDILYCNTDEGECTGTAEYKALGGDPQLVENRIAELFGDKASVVEYNQQFADIQFNESFVDKVSEAVSANKVERKTLKQKFNDDGSNSQGRTLMEYLRNSGSIEVINPPVPEDASKESWAKYDEEKRAVQEKLSEPLENSILFQGDLTLNNAEDSSSSGTSEAEDTEGTEENTGEAADTQITIKQLVYKQGAKDFREEIIADSDLYKSNWFIVNGDLTINSDDTTPIQVKGNILVTGSLTIKGNVEMDATIFTLGNSGQSTEISDAKIKGMDGKELLLFSRESILITRVNSFDEIHEEYKPTAENNLYQLDAFFYTEKSAELYGVGSIFWIRGGFFAKEELILHAVRGNTEPSSNESSLLFMPDESPLKSRMILQSKGGLLDNQGAALPRVDSITVKVGSRKLCAKGEDSCE